MSFPLETGARGCSDCLGASGFEFLLTAILRIAHVDCLLRVACHDFRADCCLLIVWLLCRSISCIDSVLATSSNKITRSNNSSSSSSSSSSGRSSSSNSSSSSDY